MMEDIKAKAEALIAQMKKDRGGSIYPEWEFAARNDPDFVTAYNNLYRAALGDGKHLPSKTKELVAICLLAFRGELVSVEAHIRKALKLGATKEEIFEALESTICPGGATTFFLGLTALVKVVGDTKD